MNTDVEWLLGPSGPFASAFPGYQPRPSQIKYAKAVAGTLAEGVAPLFIEGPTGVGKSVGYLTPAIAHALTQGEALTKVWNPETETHEQGTRKRHIVVATSNIALQEQLVGKDLPSIQKATGWDFKYALLKGRSNFMCPRNAEALRSEKEATLVENDDYAVEITRILDWAERTEFGDKSEISPAPADAAWAAFVASADDCDGRKCSFYEACPYYSQRRRSMDAHVIVTNYHLLFTEIVLRQELGQPVLLPPFDVLICDEGHDAESIARNFFASTLSSSALQNMGRLLNGKLLHLQQTADEVWDLARQWDERADTYLQTNRGSLLYSPDAFKDLKERASGVLLRVVRDVESEISREKDKHGFGGCSVVDLPPDLRKRVTAMAKPGVLAKTYLRKVDNLFPEKVDHNGTVNYISQEKRKMRNGQWKTVNGFSACPFDIGAVLRDNVWSQSEKLIVTSATLAVGSDFSYVRRALGLPSGEGGTLCYELVVDSPFDFNANMGVYIADDINPSDGGGYQTAERIANLIKCSDGRALVLFTSYRALNEAYDLISGMGLPYRLLKQGEESRSRLVDMFRTDTHSCLFATRSFFQGIDIQGESLSLVIIDKIPFPMMNDPFMEKIKALEPRRWFNSFYLPEALMHFRQAIGRLIRSVTDRGVVAILDGRVGHGDEKKNYASRFRNAIGSNQTLSLEGVAAFFGRELSRVTSYGDRGDDIPF